MKKTIALGILLSTSLCINAVPNMTDKQDLKIYHCELELQKIAGPRFGDIIVSGNLVINDILESNEQTASTHLTLSSYVDYDYEARINFVGLEQNTVVIGAMRINKKGLRNNDYVAYAEINDTQAKHIDYFDTDTGTQYDLRCHYRN
ncbi:MAG: hypothetical protein KBD64_02095 [Gammaproteobacteria bacterium]|nr:hypothetical protein [Gammaproteobacteria bacterium]